MKIRFRRQDDVGASDGELLLIAVIIIVIIVVVRGRTIKNNLDRTTKCLNNNTSCK